MFKTPFCYVILDAGWSFLNLRYILLLSASSMPDMMDGGDKLWMAGDMAKESRRINMKSTVMKSKHYTILQLMFRDCSYCVVSSYRMRHIRE